MGKMEEDGDVAKSWSCCLEGFCPFPQARHVRTVSIPLGSLSLSNARLRSVRD